MKRKSAKYLRHMRRRKDRKRANRVANIMEKTLSSRTRIIYLDRITIDASTVNKMFDAGLISKGTVLITAGLPKLP